MRQTDRIIVNAISNYALTFLAMIGSMIMMPFVMADLGKRGFGLASMIIAAQSMIEMLAYSIGRGLQRYIPQNLAAGADRSGIHRVFNTALAFFVVVGAGSAAIVFLIRNWLLRDESAGPELQLDAHRALWLLLAYLVVGLPMMVYRAGLESLQRYDLVSLFEVILTCFRTLILVFAFWLDRGSITLLIGVQLASVVVGALLCRRLLFRQIPGLCEAPRMISRSSAWLLATFTTATLLATLGNVLVGGGFRLLVGSELGMEQLGELAVVLMITSLMWKLIYNLAGVLIPAVSSIQSQGNIANVGKVLISGTKYAVIIAVGVSLVPLAVTLPFFRLWVGMEMNNLGRLVFFLLLIQILLTPGSMSQPVLIGLGRLRVMSFVVFARGVAGLALAFAYIQVFGPSLGGAAICSLGVQAVGSVEIFLYASKALGIPRLAALHETIVQPTALGIPAALATWLLALQLGTNSWLRLAAAVVVGEALFGILVMLWALRGEEKTHLWSFVRRTGERCGLAMATGGRDSGARR